MASAGAGDATPAPQSYLLHDGVFVKDNVAILPTGVTMKDAPRTFVVDPDALTLGDVLGRGASSYVQAAVHKPTGTPLALKIMSIYDKSRRGQLVREIQALYDADCDCLVSFYGAYLREGTIAIALEYMDCGTLARVAALAPGGRIPEPTVAAIAFQLLWALAYMRVEKRLHRDIKPSNVLISSAGQVKLSDFGLSAELKNSIGMAATFTGTCRYMSPERIQHSLFSFPADVWSFGLVLLEVALGRYPYPDASTYIEMAETIVESPAPTVLAAERGAFSADFVQFVASCLVKNPDERLPADILLGSPWFAKHGISGLEAAIHHTQAWLATLPPSVVVPAPMSAEGSAGLGAGRSEMPTVAAPLFAPSADAAAAPSISGAASALPAAALPAAPAHSRVLSPGAVSAADLI